MIMMRGLISWLGLSTSCSFLYLTLIITSLDGVYFDEIEEYHQCIPPTTTIPQHLSWVTHWYVPLINQVELYKNAEMVFGRSGLHERSPKGINQGSCISFRYHKTRLTETFYSFGGHSVDYKRYYDPITPTIHHYSRPGQYGKQEYVVTTYSTLSDNSTFVVALRYWSDGRKGFIVASPFKTLGDREMRRAKAHLILLGFRLEHFVQMDYDQC